MKWVNHGIVSFSLIYLATGDVFQAGVSVLGSTFPDRIEGFPPDRMEKPERYWRWRRNHRGKSHFLGAYLLVFVAVMFMKRFFFSESETAVMGLGLAEYFLIGCILHILEDMLCGKVPVWTLRKRYGFQLFRVGSVCEYLITIAIFALCLRFADLTDFF